MSAAAGIAAVAANAAAARRAAEEARKRRLRSMGYDQVLIRVTADKDKVGEAIAKVVNRKYIAGDVCEETKGFFGGKKYYIDERFTLDKGEGYTAVTIRRYDSDGYRNIREEYIERIYDALKPMGIIRTVGLGIETQDKKEKVGE